MASKSSITVLFFFVTLLVENSLQSSDWGYIDLEKTDELKDPATLHTALRNAHAQRLADLEAMEQDMDSQIRSIQKRKYTVTAQKRQHIACLVHVLACYRKR